MKIRFHKGKSEKTVTTLSETKSIQYEYYSYTYFKIRSKLNIFDKLASNLTKTIISSIPNDIQIHKNVKYHTRTLFKALPNYNNNQTCNHNKVQMMVRKRNQFHSSHFLPLL